MPDQPIIPTPAAMTPPAPAVPEPVAAPSLSRELFTLTVDHVAAELAHHGFQRDERTIQRWCKSGRLTAILDHDQGDRYLIDPASLARVVASLRQEEAQRATLPRPVAGYVPTPSDRQPDAATTAYGIPWPQAGTPPQDAIRAAADDAAARPDRDDIAALKARIAEVERENVMLAADKQVREQMVSYVQTEFAKMIDQAMEAIEKVGELRAENRYLERQNAELKALLPPAPVRPPAVPESGAVRFTPRGVLQADDFAGGPVHSEPDTPRWPGV